MVVKRAVWTAMISVALKAENLVVGLAVAMVDSMVIKWVDSKVDKMVDE